MHLYCSTYSNLTPPERQQVWLDILVALTQFESGYDPTRSYTEPFNDSAGRPVISRGLLQISQESANGYGCGITDANQLHDPRTNLQCGLKIASRWVKRDGVVAGGQNRNWLGMARYWSPFRNSKRDEIRAVVAGTPLCRR